ncbi:ATP-binding cassette domain-containing protein [Streptomyces sp. NPDC094049]|uniref:ATP-binding cassette domain-containing protein n=1 Tax=Streptomyces sp. NPDC094049 TaxID=3154987 RepID=UPI003332EA48
MPIALTNCSFSYRKRTPVLTRVNLVFAKGTNVLLGPNGAGKSTLLALAASAIRPNSGHVRLNGVGTRSRSDLRAYRLSVGWLPQQVRPIAGLKVREQVAYAGWLKGMSRANAWESSLAALRDVDLADFGARRGSELSGGQLRRLGIAQVLVHQADVVLMDEPTAGLDPRQRQVFREMVDRLATRASVVISTHQTEDLADVYDNVVVLDRGQVRFEGPVDSFLSLAPGSTSMERRAEASYARVVAMED